MKYKGQWTNPNGSTAQMKGQQTRTYRNGQALQNHIAQHGGKIDPTCPACSEIVRKMDSMTTRKEDL